MPPAIPGNDVCLAFVGGRCAKKLNTAHSCKNNPLKVLRIGPLLKYATVYSPKRHIYFLFLRFYPFFCAGPGATNRTGRQEQVGKKKKKE
jgi:hypothetical protein